MKLPAALSRLILGLATAGAAIWLALDRDRLDPALIEGAVRDLGLLAPLAHVLLFAVAAGSCLWTEANFKISAISLELRPNSRRAPASAHLRAATSSLSA